MLGGLLRKRRLENALFAKELASLIGVTEDTIINWEKGRTYPCQKHVLLLKEQVGEGLQNSEARCDSSCRATAARWNTI